jgi:multiple sugar transport system substrate-binding protein
MDYKIKRRRMMKRKAPIILVALVVVFSLMFLVASGDKKEKAAEAPKAEKKAEKQPEALTLSVLTMTGPFISGPIKAHAPEFKTMTGNTVEAIEVSFGDIFPKAKQAAMTKSDAFDMLLAANIWMADFVGLGYVIPLDDYLAGEDWYPSDVPEGIVKKNTFGGKTYGLICDNDNQYLFYRKDILGNPDYQAKFKKKYGYSYNVPPKTLEELVDVATFFNNWDWDNDGDVEYGFVRNTKRGSQAYWYSFSWAAPYAVIPSDKISTPGIFFFNPENMKPLVNNPGWVKGLDLYAKIGREGSAPGLDWERASVINEFVLGHAAMAIDWGDIGPHAYYDVSVVKGKVGYALPPGSNEYWDWKQNKWVKTDKINYAPVHCFNGWSWYITSTTKHPDECWDFISFMMSERISSIDVATPDSGFQPWRISHSKNLDSWKANGWDAADAKAYIQNTLDVTDHPNSVIDLRVPGASDYFEGIYEPYLTTILSGENTAKGALDKVAKEWDALTDRLGRDKQIEFYKWHLNYR